MTDPIRVTQGLGPIEAISFDEWPIHLGKKRSLGEDIHVWRYRRDLNVDGRLRSDLSQLLATLSLWEQKKAMSMPFAQEREDFVIGRGILRRLLGQYLGIPAKDVEIRNNRFGKPFVTDRPENVQFNISQSAHEQVFAFAQNQAVGIDLELVDHDVDWSAMAARHFSVSEIDELMRLPHFKRVFGFYKTWTVKEAYLKVLGQGYEVSTKSFCVNVDPALPAELIRAHSSQNAQNYSFYQLPIGPRYSCSLAVAGPPKEIRLFLIR